MWVRRGDGLQLTTMDRRDRMVGGNSPVRSELAGRILAVFDGLA